MNGWTVPTTVFLVSGLFLSAGVCGVYYLARLAAWWREQTAWESCRCPQCRTASTLRGGR